MLQAIHDNLKGVFAMIVIGALAVVFTFWGVEFVSVGGLSSTTGIEVNGKDLPTAQLQQDYQQELARFQSALRGQELPAELRERIKQGVIDRTVTAELVRQRTDDLRFRATDAEVIASLQQVAAFQVDGKFSKDAYYAALRAANLQPAQFEAQQKQAVAAQQLDRGIFVSAFYLPGELKRREALVNETREIAWLVLPAARFQPSGAPDEATLAAWYDQHKDKYRSAERANLQYVEIDLAGLAASVNVTDEALRAYYEDNLDRYSTAERRQLRHILFTSGGDDAAAKAAAEAAYQRAEKGEDFAALARELSQDPGSAREGGDLGWQERGSFVGPFADAAFSLQPGEISPPVKTQFGWHVIKLEGIQPGSTRSFEEVRPELEPDYRRMESEKLFGDLQEQLDTEAFEAGGDLQRVATSMALDVHNVDGFTRENGGALGNSPELVKAVFDPEVLNGSRLRTVELAPGRVVAIKVVAYQPAQDRPLDEVRAQVVADYKAEQAREQAGKRASELAGELRAGADWGTMAKPWIPAGVEGPTSATPRYVRRGEAAVPPSIGEAVFAAGLPDGKPIFGTGALDSGDAVVWTVMDVKPGSLASLSAADRDQAQRSAREQSAMEDTSVYIAMLRATADVKVNPQLLQ